MVALSNASSPDPQGAHPGGNSDDCEMKGVAGKAIRKTMKTKGRQKRCMHSGETQGSRLSERHPPPVFYRRSLDLLECKGVDVFRNDKEFARV